MTRKHFQAIADVIATIESKKVREEVAKDMAYAVGRFNSNFNRQRFLDACEPKPIGAK
jgi:hypothetical protein